MLKEKHRALNFEDLAGEEKEKSFHFPFKFKLNLHLLVLVEISELLI